MHYAKKAISAIALGGIVIGTMLAKDTATESLVNNYMRSSIYTILLNSTEQNARYEQEAKDAEQNKDAIVQAVSSIASKDSVSDNSSLFSLPAELFPTIEIPAQFNDHNLAERVINYETWKEGITEDEAKQYNQPSKTKSFGKFAKSLAGSALGAASGKDGSSMLKVDEVDDYAPAVLHKYLTKTNVASNMLAKWYDYSADNANHWDLNLVTERGNYNFTADELSRAAQDQALSAKISETAFNMIDNTYVVAVNLRFRSYQAVQEEAAAMAKAAGSALGGIGSLAAQAASTASSFAVGEGYTVQAVSFLYKLKWNDDLNQKFAVDIYEKNATIEDLISSGICELEFVGKSKAHANVRQRVISNKPMSELVKRATARAIDASIAKLQETNEVFRTVTPIIGGDGNGTIYAAIGTKEGLSDKDTYEILEASEDANGHIQYKSVGEVKPVKGKIWNNLYGAEEEAAENAVDSKSADKDFDNNAVSLGQTEFKGKKGDYVGYFLRLKKKK
jgi:hypothetical protein